MSFIESAFFYTELIQIHEDTEGRELSTREACQRINADGFSIDPSRLVRYRYGVQLYQFIPKALEGGLGRTTLDAIRQQERTYRTLWSRHSQNFAFDLLWSETLAACDHPETFDLGHLQSQFEQRMATELSLNLRHLTAEADLLIQQPDPEEVQALTPQRPTGRSPGTDASPPPTAPTQRPFATQNETVETEQQLDAPSNATATRSTTQKSSPRHSGAAHRSVSPAQAPPAPAAQPISPPPQRYFINLTQAMLLADNVPQPDQIQTRFSEEVNRPHEHDDNALFQAVKPVVGWIKAILSCWPQLRYANPDSEMEPVGLLPDDMSPTSGNHRYRLDFYPLANHQPLGDLLIDHVWWRIWKAIEGPYIDDAPEMIERTVRAMNEVFVSTFDALKIDLRSPLLFSDPACEWIDEPLRQLEAATREFHHLRRQDLDRFINPLGQPD